MEYQVINEEEAREKLRQAAIDDLTRIELDHLRHTLMIEADTAAGKDTRWREQTLVELETEHAAVLEATPPDLLAPAEADVPPEEVPES